MQCRRLRVGSFPRLAKTQVPRNEPHELVNRPTLEPAGFPPPRRRTVVLLLLGTFALALYVWSSIEGYNLADSVETMAIADRIVRHGELAAGTRSVRPAALPLLYAPFIYVDKWLTGLADQRIAFPLARGFQALLSVVFVWATVRLATRVAGPRCAVAAGVLAAVNPIFLRHAVDPLPGLAAGTLFAVGLERLIERGSFRRALLGGLCIGGAMIIAYKVLPLAGALFLVLLARDRWKHRAGWLGLGTGMLVGLGIGCLIDGLIYGVFGLSLSNYLAYNIFVTVYPVLSGLGLRDAAAWLASAASLYYGTQTQADPDKLEARIEGHSSATWYVTHSLDFLVWPALLLVLIGVVRSVRRPGWATSVILFSTVAFAAVLSAKHSKEYRLLLPALPLIATLGGLGWVLLAGPVPRTARSFSAAVLLLVAGVLGVRQFQESMPRGYGAYPQAAEWINRRTSEEDSVQFSAACTPHNMLFRTSARQKSYGLRRQLLDWPTELTASYVRPVVLREWDRLTWMIVYGVTLGKRAGLRAEIDRAFELDAAFYDRGHHWPSQGPLYVFRNRKRGGGTDRLFVRRPEVNPVEWRQEHHFGRAIQFERRGVSPTQVLNLLGSEMFEVPGSGLLALRLHWTVATHLDTVFTVVVRITANDGAQVARGRLPVSFEGKGPEDWQPGEVVVDTRLLGIKAEILRQHGGLREVKLSVDAGPWKIEPTEWMIPLTDKQLPAGEEPEVEIVIDPRWIGEDSPF